MQDAQLVPGITTDSIYISSAAADAQSDHVAHFELCGKLVASGNIARNALRTCALEPLPTGLVPTGLRVF